MPRFGVSGGPRLGRQVRQGTGVAGPSRSINYRQQMGKGGSFTYRWNGGAVINDINRLTADAFGRIASLAEREWVAIVHVISGHLRDSAHFIVDIGRNGKVTLIVLNDAEYADFEERGTINRAGHFPMRQTMDRVVPRVPGIMAETYKAGGYA